MWAYQVHSQGSKAMTELSIAERAKLLLSVIEEFSDQNGTLTANDLKKILSKRYPEWKLSRDEVALMEKELTKGFEEAKEVKEGKEVQNTAQAGKLSFRETLHSISILKSLLLVHTKEEILDMLKVLAPDE